MQTLRLIVFPAGFNWPVWVAREQGWFAWQGLDVEVTATPGSVYQLAGLVEGRFDIALTLVDNVIAYREGQGEVPLTGADLFAFMGADARSLPSLVTLPEIQSYADLRGKVLSVDAKQTGLALALRGLLEHNGLLPDDYTIVSVGGVRERRAALLERRHAGALFNSPFEAELRSRGFNVLDSVATIAPRYLNHVGAARMGWAQENRRAVVGFIRAYLRAVNWLYQPANREAAYESFIRNMPGADRAAAAGAYGILFDPAAGFPRDGAIDQAGLEQVLALRERFGQPKRPMQSSACYTDMSFLADATRLVSEMRQ